MDFARSVYAAALPVRMANAISPDQEPGPFANLALPNLTSQQHNSAQCPRDTTVAWQTAFFGLVGIAINSMTQPSGQVLGLSSKRRTYLRASPIVNLLDACVVIVQMVYFLIDGRGLRGSAQSVLQSRFVDDEDSSKSEGMQVVERDWRLRLIIFLLGGALGAIKLFAMRGMPWTQAWAGMYLGSFLVIEVVCALARYERGAGYETTVNEPHSTRWFFISGTQTMILIWAFLRAVSPFPQVPDPYSRVAGWAMAMVWLTSTVFDVYVLWRRWTDDDKFGYAIAAMAIPRITVLSMIFQTKLVNGLHLDIGNMAVMMVLYCILFILSFYPFLVIVTFEQAYPFLGWLNILVPLFYYRFAFDSASTFKPQWVDVNLG